MKNLYSEIDGLCVLLVQPGFIGQRMVQGSLEKVRDLHTLVSEYRDREIAIEADGNVTFEHAKILKEYGTSCFVCGSSSIFGGSSDELEENIYRFRSIVG